MIKALWQRIVNAFMALCLMLIVLMFFKTMEDDK